MLYVAKVFDDKSRRKYGLVSNYIYNLKAAKEWDQKLFWGEIFLVFPTVAASLLGTWLPSRLVADLSGGMGIPGLVLEIALIAAVMWICNVAANVMTEYCEAEGNFINTYYAQKYAEKIMDVDYDYLEDEGYQKIYGNAWRVARFGQGVAGAVQTFSGFLSCSVGVVLYGILLGRKSMLLLLVITASLGVSLRLLSFVRKKHGEYYERLQLSARKEGYITAQATDSAAGKDIRIYHLMDWFLEKYDAALAEMGRIYGIIHDWYLFRNVSHAFLQLLMDGAAFGLLVYMLAQEEITASEFVFYIGLASGFSTYFEGVLRQVMWFGNTSASISYMREFLETEDGWNRGDGVGAEAMERMRKNAVKLELRNVSFTYPGSSGPTLKNINVTVHAGEKVALIGLNGAGKTTLVKLICGFYHPTEGEILLNGIPAQEFNREEWYSLMAVLFQDFTFPALTLDENLTGQEPEFRAGGYFNGKAAEARKQISGYEARSKYYLDILSGHEKQKDLRVCKQQRLYQKEFGDIAFHMKKGVDKMAHFYVLDMFTQQSVSALTGFLVYVFAGMLACVGIISIGNVVTYAASILKFTDAVGRMAILLNRLKGYAVFAGDYVEYMNLPQRKHEGAIPVEKRRDGKFSVEFDHVSFRYPGSETYVLKDLNLKFEIGEKMAIVGKNGSGKTTFIKLLCRLYDVTEGCIKVNGIDIRKYDYAEYCDLFAVVFQDFQVFSFPLGENVASGSDVDAKRAEEALERAGLGDRYRRLPEGLRTSIGKEFEENGVTFSGGEKQKTAIARAIYKDAPFVIMDEPTAALDPESECEVYAGFDKMVGNKTSIYISHRLASCRFCQDILVFDQGKVIQRGSHEELEHQTGLYRELWEAQAQYYA